MRHAMLSLAAAGGGCSSGATRSRGAGQGPAVPGAEPLGALPAKMCCETGTWCLTPVQLLPVSCVTHVVLASTEQHVSEPFTGAAVGARAAREAGEPHQTTGGAQCPGPRPRGQSAKQSGPCGIRHQLITCAPVFRPFQACNDCPVEPTTHKCLGKASGTSYQGTLLRLR